MISEINEKDLTEGRVTRVQWTGVAFFVLIPKFMAQALKLKRGDYVRVVLREGSVIVTPLREEGG